MSDFVDEPINANGVSLTLLYLSIWQSNRNQLLWWQARRTYKRKPADILQMYRKWEKLTKATCFWLFLTPKSSVSCQTWKQQYRNFMPWGRNASLTSCLVSSLPAFPSHLGAVYNKTACSLRLRWAACWGAVALLSSFFNNNNDLKSVWNRWLL